MYAFNHCIYLFTYSIIIIILFVYFIMYIYLFIYLFIFLFYSLVCQGTVRGSLSCPSISQDIPFINSLTPSLFSPRGTWSIMELLRKHFHTLLNWVRGYSIASLNGHSP